MRLDGMKTATLRLAAAIGLSAGLLAAVSPASAQLAAGGGPIDITADELELVDSQHLAIWRGDVEALQGGNRMRAGQINIYFSGKSGASGAGAPGRNWGPVTRVEATGNVFFVSPQQTARGDKALYELGPNTITITGDVVVAQGKSVVRGDRMMIDVRSGKATMLSAATGRNARGRVRGVFYPDDAKNPGVAAPLRRQ
ncbi:MAG: LptA/OstA family protein [Caulobacteraceae bacterium]